MRLVRLAALVVLLLPAQAWAFDWFGLRSGMTLDQVRAAAPAGSTLRLNGAFGFIEKDGAAVATVTFCKGRLVGLSRTIDAQSDWFSLADRMIKQYGAPKVTPASDPWAEPQANVSKGLELSWRSGPNKYALTSYPQPQPVRGPGQGKGQAQGQGQGKALASLSVADLGPVNACVSAREAAHPQVRKASSVRRVTHSAHSTRASREARVTRVKHVKPRLPPIGGAKLVLALRAAQPAQPQAAPSPRPRSAAPAEPAVSEASAPGIDPASARGRILQFFGAMKTRLDARGAVPDR